MFRAIVFNAGLLLCLALVIQQDLPYQQAHARPEHHPQHEHEGRGRGKPAAQVWLEGATAYRLEPGQARQLNLRLSAAADHGVLHVALETDPGLTILSNKKAWQLQLGPASEWTLPLELVAAQAGDYFVHIFTEHEGHNGTRLARVLAFLVQVGDEQTQPRFYKSSSQPEPGPGRIVMPAAETIR